MRALVVGGTGLIGRQVVADLLAEGADVVCASRTAPAFATAAKWKPCDVSDPESVALVFRKVRPSHVVHLAAALQFACERSPSLAARVNVLGTLHLLEAASEVGVSRFILGSSVAVYGRNNPALLHEETPPTLPLSLYGSAKRLEEGLGEHFGSLFHLNCVALRYCGVFGPGEPQSAGMALVRKLIESTRDGASVSVPEASGNERIQFTYVRDASAATLKALKHPAPKYSAYNIGGPRENHVTMRQYHEQIRKLFPDAGEVSFGAKGQDLGPLDTNRMYDDLGFAPRYTILEGLSEMFLENTVVPIR